MFKKFQKQASEVLEIPMEVLENGPRITLMGRSELIVEYYHEIIHFSEEEVILATPAGKLVISGQDMVLTTILQTEIHLTGRIVGLRFGGE